MREVYCFGNTRLVDGKWEPLKGIELGEVGKTETINGGVAVTQYSKLLEIDENRLFNAANGDILHRTRKDKIANKFLHYFSKQTGVCASVFMRALGGKDD